MANHDATLFVVLVVLPIGIAGLVFWVRMLEDCVSHEHGPQRVFWIIALLLPQFAGLLFYYFIRWRPRRRAELGLV